MHPGRRRCVGTKNGFVVTWLTKTNFHFGCDLMKLSAASAPVTAPIAGVAITAVGIDSAAAPRPTRFSTLRRSIASSCCSSGSTGVALFPVVRLIEVHGNLLLLCEI